MKKDSLGNRMKENYEFRTATKLIKRMPVIIRLDGKTFHSLTRKCIKPFDENLNNCMVETARKLCKELMGVQMAYIQSDEISLFLTDYTNLTTQGWFDYKLSKIISISSAMASVEFTKLFGADALFDSRAFNIPKEEVINYFIWRQKDWERNSLQMLARSQYSAKQLFKKNRVDMMDMLMLEKGINWAKLPRKWKNGTILLKENNFKSQYFQFTKNRKKIII